MQTLFVQKPVVQSLSICVAPSRELGQCLRVNGQRLGVVLHELCQIQQHLFCLIGYKSLSIYSRCNVDNVFSAQIN